MVCSGIRKSTTLSITTKIGPFSIPSNSKTVWPGSPSWTRKKPSNSKRKWMSERKTQAKLPRQPLFKALDRNLWEHKQMGNLITDLEALEACCTVKDLPLLRMCHHSKHNLSSHLENRPSSSMHRRVQAAIEHHHWILWILHGGEFWGSF